MAVAIAYCVTGGGSSYLVVSCFGNLRLISGFTKLVNQVFVETEVCAI